MALGLTPYEYEYVQAIVRDACAQYIRLSEYELFFFGSRVTGTASATSDIDVGIYANNKTPLPAGVLTQIGDSVREKPFLYKIDIVDMAQTTEVFREQAMRDRMLLGL
jgi:predicted nucleotidyltransferase